MQGNEVSLLIKLVPATHDGLGARRDDGNDNDWLLIIPDRLANIRGP